MTATSPLRGPRSAEGGGFAAADFPARRAGYGAAPPASRVLRIALRATALRAALDPGDHCGPWRPGRAAGPGLPPRRARRANPAVADMREHPNPQGTDELASGTHKEENLGSRRRTLESVKRHLKPNRQRSVGPRRPAEKGKFLGFCAAGSWNWTASGVSLSLPGVSPA